MKNSCGVVGLIGLAIYAVYFLLAPTVVQLDADVVRSRLEPGDSLPVRPERIQVPGLEPRMGTAAHPGESLTVRFRALPAGYRYRLSGRLAVNPRGGPVETLLPVSIHSIGSSPPDSWPVWSLSVPVEPNSNLGIVRTFEPFLRRSEGEVAFELRYDHPSNPSPAVVRWGPFALEGTPVLWPLAICVVMIVYGYFRKPGAVVPRTSLRWLRGTVIVLMQAIFILCAVEGFLHLMPKRFYPLGTVRFLPDGGLHFLRGDTACVFDERILKRGRPHLRYSTFPAHRTINIPELIPVREAIYDAYYPRQQFEFFSDRLGFPNEEHRPCNVVLVGDSFLDNRAYPRELGVGGVLERLLGESVYCAALPDTGLVQHRAFYRDATNGWKPETMVYFYYGGNDLDDYNRFTSFLAQGGGKFNLDDHWFAFDSRSHKRYQRTCLYSLFAAIHTRYFDIPLNSAQPAPQTDEASVRGMEAFTNAVRAALPYGHDSILTAETEKGRQAYTLCSRNQFDLYFAPRLYWRERGIESMQQELTEFLRCVQAAGTRVIFAYIPAMEPLLANAFCNHIPEPILARVPWQRGGSPPLGEVEIREQSLANRFACGDNVVRLRLDPVSRWDCEVEIDFIEIEWGSELETVSEIVQRWDFERKTPGEWLPNEQMTEPVHVDGRLRAVSTADDPILRTGWLNISASDLQEVRVTMTNESRSDVDLWFTRKGKPSVLVELPFVSAEPRVRARSLAGLFDAGDVIELIRLDPSRAANDAFEIDSLTFTAERIVPAGKVVSKRWDFDVPDDLEGWRLNDQLQDVLVKDGSLFARSTGGDPFMECVGLDVPANRLLTVRVGFVRGSSFSEVHFITASEYLPPVSLPARAESFAQKEMVLEAVRGAGIEVLDFTDSFVEETRAGEPVFIPFDLHWNDHGMAVAAERIAERLRSAE